MLKCRYDECRYAECRGTLIGRYFHPNLIFVDKAEAYPQRKKFLNNIGPRSVRDQRFNFESQLSGLGKLFIIGDMVMLLTGQSGRRID
jgi:hypothetical protein